MGNDRPPSVVSVILGWIAVWLLLGVIYILFN